MTVSGYWELKDSVMAWVRCRSPKEKRILAPDLLIRMIDFFSTADQHELAKAQISKAIRAMKRGDVTSVDVHMESAFITVSGAPTNFEWEDLRAEVEKLRKTLRKVW